MKNELRSFTARIVWIRLGLTTILIATLIVIPVLFLSQFRPYYFNAFERYSIYQNFKEEYDKAELDQQFSTVFAFIAPPFTQELDSEFFSQEDILHLQDVQKVFQALWIIGMVGTTFTIGLGAKGKQDRYKNREQEIPILRINYRKILLGIIIIAGAIYLFWDKVFILFHQILFPYNTYWSLDPQTSSLIKFLPEEIFVELSLILAFLVILEIFCYQRIVRTFLGVRVSVRGRGRVDP